MKCPRAEIPLLVRIHSCIFFVCFQQGKVKNVVENYTQNFTEPTVGFDCHMSEQLPSVSAKTSSFLAFERTQVRFQISVLKCAQFN